MCSWWRFASPSPKQAPWASEHLSNAYFRHVFRNAIVGHAETGSPRGFWRCSVVSPYTANYNESQRAHSTPVDASERDISLFFQGGANSRGTYGYAFRQAVLAQLQDFPAAHVSAYNIPGKPVPCKDSLTTNCRSGRAGATSAFRRMMARSRFNLVVRGDSPSSRRLYDGERTGSLVVAPQRIRYHRSLIRHCCRRAHGACQRRDLGGRTALPMSRTLAAAQLLPPRTSLLLRGWRRARPPSAEPGLTIDAGTYAALGQPLSAGPCLEHGRLACG